MSYLNLRANLGGIVILNFSFGFLRNQGKYNNKFFLYKTYRALSKAPVDILWQKIVNLADVSWHPLINQSNAPWGLAAKPGIIYQVVTRFTPIPVRIFVERVCPREFLSFRVLALPGVEQRITYQIESTLCGTYISYSVTLRGWLSPLLWWLIKPYTARVASELANSIELKINN
ncbi:MAG: SRPBCC family protein [Spirulinaceae cyanobacterium]